MLEELGEGVSEDHGVEDVDALWEDDRVPSLEAELVAVTTGLTDGDTDAAAEVADVSV